MDIDQPLPPELRSFLGLPPPPPHYGEQGVYKYHWWPQQREDRSPASLAADPVMCAPFVEGAVAEFSVEQLPRTAAREEPDGGEWTASEMRLAAELPCVARAGVKSRIL